MVDYKILNEEVLCTTETLTLVNGKDVALLKSMALKNTRQRLRLCAHNSIEDTLHEMIIVLAKGAYIRPHKHQGRSESFHIIEGSLKVVIFDDHGTLLTTFNMTAPCSDAVFFYRLSKNSFHTVIPQSSLVVFHEVTNGPFKLEDTAFAPWAPDENDHEAVKKYMDQLSEQISIHK